MEKEDLVAIANTAMPFGKYQGRMLINLPEPYLLWFAHKGAFPEGRLGQLMSLALAIKIEGLESLITPLKAR
ncbi:cytoplasmic protein [Sodalis-like symbiont of Bactericera trigonica]|nr:cytoplasmic protein [Sodalis-like symbiont of Bactericera trigonica]